MRLQAFLSRSGAAPSRRKAEALISAGRVSVNGRTATLGESLDPETATVRLDGRPVSLPTSHTYLALNKPPGYLTTLIDERGRPTVADLMPAVPGLVPAGRLDAETTGLLLLTTDGLFANHVTHPSSEIEKEYRVTVRGPAPRKAIDGLISGPTLDDGPMLPPRLTHIRRSRSQSSFHLIIHEGRNRIIRRACKAVGLHITSLERRRIGPVKLENLPPGNHRKLTEREICILQNHD